MLYLRIVLLYLKNWSATSTQKSNEGVERTTQDGRHDIEIEKSWILEINESAFS